MSARAIDQDAWREALLADLAHEARLLPGRTLTSIFFGGGTPSLMEPATVAAVIDAAREHWAPADDLEITLEANPNSVEAARFADLAAAGVNRLSLGLQSFDDEALAFLGRAHSAREGLRALEIAQSNFRRVSFDLIYALARRHRGRLVRDARPGAGARHVAPVALPADDRAGHALRQRWSRSGEFEPLDADAPRRSVRADRRDDVGGRACRPTRSATMRGPAQESRHNLTYWRYGDYAGIGPGAHGRRLGHAHGAPPQARELPVGAARATATASPRKRPCRRSKPPTRRWSWACGCAKGSTPTRSPRRFGLHVDRRLGAGRSARRVRPSDRDGGRIALTRRGPAAARPRSSARSPPSLFRRLGRRCRRCCRRRRSGGSLRLASAAALASSAATRPGTYSCRPSSRDNRRPSCRRRRPRPCAHAVLDLEGDQRVLQRRRSERCRRCAHRLR